MSAARIPLGGGMQCDEGDGGVSTLDLIGVGGEPVEELALMVIALLERLGVMDPDAVGEAAVARPLAAVVLAGLDRLLAERATGDAAIVEIPLSRQERYGLLVDRVRRLLQTHVHEHGGVAVISRGDRALTDLQGRTASHFPQDEHGGWAGHYPADGRAAVTHLEEVRRRGVSYLAIPASGRWWLDHYTELRAHLDLVGHVLVDDEDLVLFQLQPLAESPRPMVTAPDTPLASMLRAIVPDQASVVVATNDEHLEVERFRRNQWTVRSTTGDGAVAAGVVQAAADRPDAVVVVVLVHSGSSSWASTHPQLWSQLLCDHHLLADRPGLATVVELVRPSAPANPAASSNLAPYIRSNPVVGGTLA